MRNRDAQNQPGSAKETQSGQDPDESRNKIGGQSPHLISSGVFTPASNSCVSVYTRKRTIALRFPATSLFVRLVNLAWRFPPPAIMKVGRARVGRQVLIQAASTWAGQWKSNLWSTRVIDSIRSRRRYPDRSTSRYSPNCQQPLSRCQLSNMSNPLART